MQTRFEQILERVQAILLTASLEDVGAHVFRDREDALPEAELPAIKVLRGQVDPQAWAAGADRTRMEFRLEIIVSGENRETHLDAIHKAAHDVLLADVTLGGLGQGLRFSGSEEPEHAAGDPPAARMRVRYEIQTLTRSTSLVGAP